MQEVVGTAAPQYGSSGSSSVGIVVGILFMIMAVLLLGHMSISFSLIPMDKLLSLSELSFVDYIE